MLSRFQPFTEERPIRIRERIRNGNHDSEVLIFMDREPEKFIRELGWRSSMLRRIKHEPSLYAEELDRHPNGRPAVVTPPDLILTTGRKQETERQEQEPRGCQQERDKISDHKSLA
jgi:hypothetical protein